MPRYIAFLRAINVGGHNVSMEKLRSCFEELKFQQVQTFIASGNVIFNTRSTKPDALQAKIEPTLLKNLGYEVKTFIRTDAEVAAVATCKPFSASLLENAAALNVGFLEEEPTAEHLEKIAGFKTEIDDFQVHGRELYWLCRVKQSESKFSNVMLERALKKKATFRGLNTIKRLAAKYPPT